MRISLILFFTFISGFSAVAYEDKESNKPVRMGMDLLLFQNPRASADNDKEPKYIDPRVFFEERRKNNPKCVSDLNAARKHYDDLKTALVALLDQRKNGATITNKEIDDAEGNLNSSRDLLLAKTSECGYCYAKKVANEKRGGKTWLVSDGTCQYPGTDPVKLAKLFKFTTDFLLTPRNYAKKNGGFSSIMEFSEVNHITGGPASNQRLTVNPTFLFIGVKGPPLFTGWKPAIFTYYIKGKWGFTPPGTPTGKPPEPLPSGTPPAPPQELSWSFNAHPFPGEDPQDPRPEITSNFNRLFKTPGFKDKRASGTSIDLSEVGLRQVEGNWFVTADGHVRYATSAAFPVSFKSAESMGRNLLLDMLVETYDRGMKEIQ